jgi:hypothetical protein
MTHFPSLNLLAIYGGRNDDLYKVNKTAMLGDLFVLELDTFTWASVKLQGDAKGPRCSHVAGALGTKLIIFGGISFNKYSASETHIIELDPTLASRLQKNYDKKSAILPEVSPEGASPELKQFVTIDPFEKYSGLVSFLPVPTKKELKKQIETQIQERESYNRKENKNKTYRMTSLKKTIGSVIAMQRLPSPEKKQYLAQIHD